MAAIPVEELADIRREYAAANTVTAEKATYNAAIQAIEDWWIANAAALAAAINTATAPVVLTNPQKREMGRLWLRNKFGRGN